MPKLFRTWTWACPPPTRTRSCVIATCVCCCIGATMPNCRLLLQPSGGNMQIGFNLPISGPLSSPGSLIRIAQQGEALGYDYLTLTDHIVLPNLQVPGYPYSESGEFFAEGPERRHEQLTTAAYIAAKTSRIGLVLAVMVVPHRPAVLAAKMLATIDVLSGGRLTVGIGAGWLKTEFDAVVTTPFAERGAVTDEYVAAFRTLWTANKPKIDGRHVP